MGVKRAKKGHGIEHDIITTSVGIPKAYRQELDRRGLNLSQVVRDHLREMLSSSAEERIQALQAQINTERNRLDEEKSLLKVASELDRAMSELSRMAWQELGSAPSAQAVSDAYKRYCAQVFGIVNDMPTMYKDLSIMRTHKLKEPIWKNAAKEQGVIL